MSKPREVAPDWSQYQFSYDSVCPAGWSVSELGHSEKLTFGDLYRVVALLHQPWLETLTLEYLSGEKAAAEAMVFAALRRFGSLRNSLAVDLTEYMVSRAKTDYGL